MAVKMGTFSGANVFLSRNLVPPEMFDALHDALRLNGAQVFLCCDPSRNSPTDYHVISSPDHEKFEDLRAKGCNLLGPHCVLSCAKERRVLPKQRYTCCLAMDGVKVLASGFEKDEKVKIEQLVTAMGGACITKAALDVSFVIAKNVLAAKYKWAVYILKKPVVDMSWLRQCWTEHRVVPQEPYKILPFTGLTICVTRIPADEREEIRRFIIQNGGKYSADLTKKCTHLISDAPEGDKYMVAKKWGNIRIVSRKWLDQSIARKACLDEGHYSVHRVSVPCNTKNGMKEQYSQDQSNKNSEPTPSTEFPDVDVAISQNFSSTISDGNNIRSEDSDIPIMRSKGEPKFDGNVAEDSEDEDNDLYLSSCRILLVGFEEKEFRRLVNMIRKGGGSRHMLLSERLTHIIVGTPSEIEKKEVRRLAAWGVINVVKPVWLEDCDQIKKEAPVSQRHIACDLLLPRDTTLSNKIAPAGVSEMKNAKGWTALPNMSTSQIHLDESNYKVSPLDKKIGTEMLEVVPKEAILPHLISKPRHGNKLNNINVVDKDTCSFNSSGTQRKPTNVFKGLSFCFSSSFPKDKRTEIEEWVMQGGGMLVTHHCNVHVIIECHGVTQKFPDVSPSTMVSSHWIRFCLEEGCLLDIGSHILFSPLRCIIPLAGYESIRFCISQYEDKERVLLKNLCFTLGAKFTEKLTKRVTHLLCKFANGTKYEAAGKWGIESVTAEWINECIKQGIMVAMDQFRPKAVTAHETETGICITSQYPTQAAYMVSGDVPSQLLNESETSATKQRIGTRSSACAELSEFSGALGKRQRYSENKNVDDGPLEIITVEHLKRGSNTVSDVADAIEDLLAQSNKIKDMKTNGDNGCHQSMYSPGHFILGQDHTNSSSSFQISDHRLNRFDKPSTTSNSPACDRNRGTLDGFSETQTESQVVWYEEDLSGRQKIIERVRSQSVILTPESK